MPPSLRYVTKAPASFETLNAEAVFVKFDIQEFTQKRSSHLTFHLDRSVV